MKRTLLAISFSALVILLYGSFATTVQGVVGVTIRGNLYKVPAPGNNLIPLNNQPVKVVCGSVTMTANTDVNGLYTVLFTDPGCGPFSFVSSESKFNNSTINRQVMVSSESRATINLFY